MAPSASSRSSNSIVRTALARGSGTRLSFASTTRPSVPSEPTISLARLNGLERSDELVEVVTADAPEHLWKAALDFRRAVARNLLDRAVAAGLERLAGARRLELRRHRAAENESACRRPARRRARARGRSSCRTEPTARRSSCWRSCRRWWRGWRWRYPGANRRPCGRSCAFSRRARCPARRRPVRSGNVDVEQPVEVLRGVELHARRRSPGRPATCRRRGR